MTYSECELVAEAALQLAAIRDSIENGAELSDARLAIARNGMSKVIGLLSALPLEAEGEGE